MAWPVVLGAAATLSAAAARQFATKIPFLKKAYRLYREKKVAKAVDPALKREALKEKTREEIGKTPGGRNLTSPFLKKHMNWKAADKALRKKYGEGGGLPY